MGHIQITINNNRITIGESLPTSITHLDIIYIPILTIPSTHVLQVKQWFNSIIDKIDCEYITFNNILIPKSDLKKIKL